jgi:hypothetical protein
MIEALMALHERLTTDSQNPFAPRGKASKYGGERSGHLRNYLSEAGEQWQNDLRDYEAQRRQLISDGVDVEAEIAHRFKREGCDTEAQE